MASCTVPAILVPAILDSLLSRRRGKNEQEETERTEKRMGILSVASAISCFYPIRVAKEIGNLGRRRFDCMSIAFPPLAALPKNSRSSRFIELALSIFVH